MFVSTSKKPQKAGIYVIFPQRPDDNKYFYPLLHWLKQNLTDEACFGIGQFLHLHYMAEDWTYYGEESMSVYIWGLFRSEGFRAADAMRDLLQVSSVLVIDSRTNLTALAIKQRQKR